MPLLVLRKLLQVAQMPLRAQALEQLDQLEQLLLPGARRALLLRVV